jgi:hypothetical protein
MKDYQTIINKHLKEFHEVQQLKVPIELNNYIHRIINEALNTKDVSGSASDFERELYTLINSYVSAGLKKPELVNKMEYVTHSCIVS